MLQIEDNFLPQEEFDKLKKLFLKPDFTWFYADAVNDFNDGDFQFTHMLWTNHYPYFIGVVSPHFKAMAPLLNKIKPLVLIRIKANLTTLRPEHIVPKTYHTDFDHDNTTGIFYLTTTNGKTVFKNGESVDCVENRYISFPSHMEHMGTAHSDENVRVVINFNYF